jgi:phosphoribosylformylglycinamidine synthase PurS subunit
VSQTTRNDPSNVSGGPSKQTWSVEVTILPKEGVNDPQGEAIQGGLHSLGYMDVDNVRAGKLIRFSIHATSIDAARESVASMCDRLLANPVIETYRVDVSLTGDA